MQWTVNIADSSWCPNIFNIQTQLSAVVCVCLLWVQSVSHDMTRGIPWWRHQMEIFPRHWHLVRGIHRSPVNSPHKGQWRGALTFSLICVRTAVYSHSTVSPLYSCHKNMSWVWKKIKDVMPKYWQWLVFYFQDQLLNYVKNKPHTITTYLFITWEQNTKKHWETL